jgi:hypothetical protein
MNEELKKGNSLADVLEKLEKGKIGHRAAMDWLNVKTYDALVEIAPPAEQRDPPEFLACRECGIERTYNVHPSTISRLTAS